MFEFLIFVMTIIALTTNIDDASPTARTGRQIRADERHYTYKGKGVLVICLGYEPELHPGVTYRIADKKATLKIFSTGSITITAPNVDTIQKAVEEAYALVFDYQKERREDDLQQFPIIERKRRRRELRIIKEEQNGHRKKIINSTNSRPPKKKARFSQDDYEDDSEPEIFENEDDELEEIIDMKTPIEVDEDETEDEAEEGFGKVCC